MEVRSIESVVKFEAPAMNPTDPPIVPDWKWGMPEGSREFDRLTDRRLTCREILEWLEEAETLSLHFQAIREKALHRDGNGSEKVVS